MKALVVDDSKTMCEMVKVTLSGLGFAVTIACDGTEAVTAAEGGSFDLIVTDINMPNMDGIELIRHLREGKYKSTPILVLTTEAGDQAKQQGKTAGATGWIVKPFKPAVLEAAVTKVCNLRAA